MKRYFGFPLILLLAGEECRVGDGGWRVPGMGDKEVGPRGCEGGARRRQLMWSSQQTSAHGVIGVT